MSLFNDYGQTSGQFLSLNKCKFYSGNLTARKSSYLAGILGFSAGTLPFTYLGIPLFKGKPKRIHLQPIADKIINKLASWKGALLSIMGRAELVKIVIQSMFLHVYSGILLAYLPPQVFGQVHQEFHLGWKCQYEKVSYSSLA